MTIMHNARPDKNLYFTEQMVTEQSGSTTIGIAARVKQLIVGAMGNWSKNVILWNLAADPLNGPHTDNGGCTMCQGAVTIDQDSITRNLAYYTIAHASKFVIPGSVRIQSTGNGDMAVELTTDEESQDAVAMRVAVTRNYDFLPNVAFLTPGGKIVLIVANDTFNTNSFIIHHDGKVRKYKTQSRCGRYVYLVISLFVVAHLKHLLLNYGTESGFLLYCSPFLPKKISPSLKFTNDACMGVL